MQSGFSRCRRNHFNNFLLLTGELLLEIRIWKVGCNQFLVKLERVTASNLAGRFFDPASKRSRSRKKDYASRVQPQFHPNMVPCNPKIFWQNIGNELWPHFFGSFGSSFGVANIIFTRLALITFPYHSVWVLFQFGPGPFKSAS